MTRFAIQWVICALGMLGTLGICGGCGNARQAAREAAPQASAPAVPSEVQAMADSLLGRGSQVVAFGDLAKNGREQALIIDPMPVKPQDDDSALLFTRAAVLERDGARWREILRCDEHLKNSSGFLGGAPLAPVTGWRLQVDGNKKQTEDQLNHGTMILNSLQTLFFTPLPAQGSPAPATIAVRWNPKLSRYQSLDQKKQFLAELTLLETPSSELR
jgi:hypothetical protein